MQTIDTYTAEGKHKDGGRYFESSESLDDLITLAANAAEYKSLNFHVRTNDGEEHRLTFAPDGFIYVQLGSAPGPLRTITLDAFKTGNY